jgi:hypothetical protein
LVPNSAHVGKEREFSSRRISGTRSPQPDPLLFWHLVLLVTCFATITLARIPHAVGSDEAKYTGMSSKFGQKGGDMLMLSSDNPHDHDESQSHTGLQHVASKAKM